VHAVRAGVVARGRGMRPRRRGGRKLSAGGSR
jgi:hypothetical protein